MARRRSSQDNIVPLVLIGGVGVAIWGWLRSKSINMPGSVTNSGNGVVLTGEARGIRNNNPGNIRYNILNQWTGQTGSDGTFAKFSSPAYGFRALFKTLNTYQNSHGLDTIAKIASRWAPSSENNTSAWASNVAINAGIPINAAINTNDRNTMLKIGRGITVAENGPKYKNYYPDSIIGAGFDAR